MSSATPAAKLETTRSQPLTPPTSAGLATNQNQATSGDDELDADALQAEMDNLMDGLDIGDEDDEDRGEDIDDDDDVDLR